MDKPRVTSSGRPSEREDGGTPTERKKANGQYEDYWVLPQEERTKPFVRPFRDVYRHVGIRPVHTTRALTEEERVDYEKYDYARYEEYPANSGLGLGRYWTQKQLSSGCGAETKMSYDLSATYARDPEYYGSTFCCGCGGHHRVEEFVWTADGCRVGS